ncbi:hypothetical protein U6R39_12090, partial [Cutibacterium acnes]
SNLKTLKKAIDRLREGLIETGVNFQCSLWPSYERGTRHRSGRNKQMSTKLKLKIGKQPTPTRRSPQRKFASPGG